MNFDLRIALILNAVRIQAALRDLVERAERADRHMEDTLSNWERGLGLTEKESGG